MAQTFNKTYMAVGIAHQVKHLPHSLITWVRSPDPTVEEENDFPEDYQVRFIPQVQTWLNTHKSINIINHNKTEDKNCMSI